MTQDSTITKTTLPNELFTIEEVTEMLKISRQLLWRLTKEKGIQVIKLGDLVRYTPDHIAQLLAAEE